MKKIPLVLKSFRLYHESAAALDAMPDRNNWIRVTIANALTQQKSA